MPVFASTPEQESAPIMSEGEIFLSDLSQLSEEELICIMGEITIDCIDGTNTFNPNT